MEWRGAQEVAVGRSFYSAVTAAFVWGLLSATSLAEAPTVADARRLLLTGRYAEAAEAFAALPEKDAVAAALGTAECHAARGQYDEAVEVLTAAAKEHPHASE